MQNLIEAAKSAVTARTLALTEGVKMWRVVVSTQVRENYGAHDWSGEGECPQYWKCKGGNDHVLGSFSDEPEQSKVDALVAEWCNKPSEDPEYYQETMIASHLLAPGQMTTDETDRLAWDPILNRLYEMVEEAIAMAKQAEREKEQADLLEQEAHRFGRARP